MPIKDITKRSEYHKKYMKEIWYPKNKIKHLKLIKKRKKDISNFIRNIKKNSVCADCGLQNKNHPEIFDFDHVNGNKKINIGSAYVIGWSKERILQEIAKCEIVCSNCHRIRTKKRNRLV